MNTNGLFKMVRPLLLLACMLPVSCSKTTTYSFVDVAVEVDPSVTMKELAAKVDSCEVQVTGAESVEGVVLPCAAAAKVGYQLGTFEWTTTLEKGQLQFVVTLFALNREVYGKGTSAPVDIIAGKRATSSVLVIAMPAPPTGTGGAGGSGAGGAPAVGGQGGTAAGGAGGSAGPGGQSGNGGALGTAGAGGSSAVGGASGAGGGAVGGTSGAAGAGGVTGAGGAQGGNGGDAGGAGGA